MRTYADWQDPPPGFAEADPVAHSGPVTRGSFVQTLVLTDIATGWTECAPLLFRERTLVSAVLTAVRRLLPFDLLGFDTDNDSVFMNETVRDYCRDASIEFTRCRPWRKNDQAFVEQKSGAIVRRIVGYRRLEGPEAVAALSQLYATVRLFVNFFQPSFKLASKTRDGAHVCKRYHPPATPFQRLLADQRTPQSVRDEVSALFVTLDPIRLLGKTLESFDFAAVPTLSKAHVMALAEGDSWLAKGNNILAFGPPGGGKSHLAAALGHALIQKGYRVLFTRTTDLVQRLQSARQNLTLAQDVAKLDKFHLLILDDLSYVQKDHAETSVLFELIAARYERRSIMITANQPFGGWDGIFPDKAMTVAAIDRLVHHAVIFEMNVESYRRRAALERATSKRDTASDIPNAQPKKDT